MQVISGDRSPQGRVADLEELELPAVKVAAVIHHGPVVNTTAADQVLLRWAQLNGQAEALQGGMWRKVNLETSGEDQGDWIMEVQLDLVGT